MSERAEERFSTQTLEMLREAGWFPGRDVSRDLKLPRGFKPFPAALKVLAEFGNLRIGRDGPGIEFRRKPVILDPMLVAGEDDRYAEFSRLLGVGLYPLGETADGHAFLAIDELGRVFFIFGDMFFVGDSFESALENLLLGKKMPPVVDEEGRW